MNKIIALVFSTTMSILMMSCGDNSDSSSADSEKQTISLDSITGFSQKGPFIKGSDVRLYELDDSTFKQTSGSFAGKIVSDDGRFRINARDLKSPYVYLQATGYYRNEYSGENSDGMLSLEAISDVGNRGQVNINLLTHLEYYRVIYLVTHEDPVTHEKMDFSKAKKQAQQEVFDAFYIETTSHKNSEDLDIGGNSDGDAALIAISALLMGSTEACVKMNYEGSSNCTAKLTDLLTSISTDMEEDGTWDESPEKGYYLHRLMRETVTYGDFDRKLSKIRENIKRWYATDSVPNFEKHFINFFEKATGLGHCDSTIAGVTRKIKLKPETEKKLPDKEQMISYKCVQEYNRILKNDEMVIDSTTSRWYWTFN